LDLPEEDRFIAQGNDSCCFVYACANAMIYMGREVPDLESVKDLAACRSGNTIHTQAVVDAMGLNFLKTKDPSDVIENGGILGIMHPIYNGHAVFVVPCRRGSDRDMLLAINSWLGPNRAILGIGEMSRFFPRWPSQHSHWYSPEPIGKPYWEL
jgi:hypothetical protein